MSSCFDRRFSGKEYLSPNMLLLGYFLFFGEFGRIANEGDKSWSKAERGQSGCGQEEVKHPDQRAGLQNVKPKPISSGSLRRAIHHRARHGVLRQVQIMGQKW